MRAKRICAMLLALCLVVSLVPASALPVFAAEQGKIETSFVNPLYEGVLDVEDISEPELRPNSAISPMADSDYLSEYQAMLLVREGLMARTADIHVMFRVGGTNPETAAAELLRSAMYPGTIPNGGDYLQWVIAGVSISGEYYSKNRDLYMDITYHVTYLTTAEQEAEMDAAVKELLDELDLYEASDYSKLKGIYDYICANVTYDYDNLEDETYTLKYTAYAALVNKTAVCQGYATLLYRLALELGVNCRVIAGYQTSTGYGHVWNIAEINDEYYNLDATWDAGWPTYDFFLVSNENCYDHTRFEEYDDDGFNYTYPTSETNYDPYPSGAIDDNFAWSYNAENWTLTITGIGDMPSWETVPWSNLKPEIRTVVIGEGITKVNDCLSNYNMEQVVLPTTIKTIANDAFSDCSNLTTIIMPEGLQSIGYQAFRKSGLTGIKIPDSVTSIGAFAFDLCRNLEWIEFSDGLTELPEYLCWNNSNLTSVTLPENLVQIGTSAFLQCGALCNIELPDTLEVVGQRAFAHCDSLGTIVIPEKVHTIGNSSFSQIKNPVTIYFTGHAPVGASTFDESVITAYYPMYDQTWTEKVMQQYGGTVTWIPYEYATGTWGENLTWVLENGALTISGEGEMYEADDPSEYSWYEYNEHIKQVVIESGVTTVAGRAFSSYRNLEKVVLPEGLTSLGRHAFSITSKLSEIQLPSTLKIIDADCFLMSGIANVTLPEGLETIGAEAFCFSKLTQIVIPNTVSSIGTDAFDQCTSLTSAVLSASCAELPMGMFRFCAALETVTIPEGVTAIGWSVFSDCGALKNVTLPESLVSIGVDAFENCTSLTEMEIPAGVTTFENPFRGCTSLSSITFLGDAPVPEGQTAFVDNNGFEGVTATIYYPANNETWTEEVMQQYGGTLTWVAYQSGVCGDDLTWTLKDGVLTISGTGEMYDMTDDTHAANSWHPYSDQVKKVIIEDGVTSIGWWGFRLHTNLEEVEIPETVTAIGEAAFGWCTSLKRLEIPAGVTKLDSFVAHGCQSLTELILPEGLVTIGRDAFANCTSLTKVVFPSTLEVISISGFAGCTSLSEIWFTGHAPAHLYMAFEGGVTATAYYPRILSTWTEEKIASYETPDTVTWMPYDLELDNPFTDVPENKYFYKPILWAYYNGITSGKTATTFEPNATCTRAQVMTFLWAAAGRPEPSSLENPFTDVSESAYYYKAVLWAVEKGITSGTSATTFSPNASCTRNQVVTFLWVNAGRPEPTIENPFTDVEEGKYYYKPILWAYENGITTGRTPTTFEPHSPCTRGQIMTFLFQALANK